jgi:hypothetical protein
MDTTVKAPIILNQSDDWPLWFSQVRTLAIVKDVWNYVNPDLPSEPELPTRPIRPTVQAIDPRAISDDQFDDKQRERWREKRRDYELDLRDYNQINTAIQTVFLLASTSISYTNKLLIQNKTSAYQILQLLKQRHAPTTETRKRYIITKYQKMTQTPHSTPNIDAWISQWENTYAEASELGIAET